MKQDINPTMMTFYQWFAQFRNQDNAIGDIARDAVADHCFPRKTTKRQKIWNHITFDHNACMAYEDTLGNALDRYEKEAKGKID